MDFEMPGSANVNDPQIVEAVRKGKLPERILDVSVERILHMVERTMPVEGEAPLLDEEKGHELACKAAAQSMVLLENNGILPLSDRAAVIGHLAEKPHFQGEAVPTSILPEKTLFWRYVHKTERCLHMNQGYRLRERKKHNSY